MNDLNEINKQNAAAVQRHIPELVKSGFYVVAEYAGLHFIGLHAYKGNTTRSAHEQAQEKLEELNSSGTSTRGELHIPQKDVNPITLSGGGAGWIDDANYHGPLEPAHSA